MTDSLWGSLAANPQAEGSRWFPICEAHRARAMRRDYHAKRCGVILAEQFDRVRGEVLNGRQQHPGIAGTDSGPSNQQWASLTQFKQRAFCFVHTTNRQHPLRSASTL